MKWVTDVLVVSLNEDCFKKLSNSLICFFSFILVRVDFFQL